MRSGRSAQQCTAQSAAQHRVHALPNACSTEHAKCKACTAPNLHSANCVQVQSVHNTMHAQHEREQCKDAQRRGCTMQCVQCTACTVQSAYSTEQCMYSAQQMGAHRARIAFKLKRRGIGEKFKFKNTFSYLVMIRVDRPTYMLFVLCRKPWIFYSEMGVVYFHFLYCNIIS